MRAWIVLLILLPGCAGTEVPPSEPVDDLPEVTPEVRRVLQTVTERADVAWEGRTKEGAWVCSTQDGTTSCPAGSQVMPDGAHTTQIPYEDNLTAVHVNMTWTPADATQTGLVLAIAGNVAGQGPVTLASARGTSPLPVTITMPGLVPDGNITLTVWPEGKTPTSPSVFVDGTRQPFTVEGVVVTQDQVWTEVAADQTA